MSPGVRAHPDTCKAAFRSAGDIGPSLGLGPGEVGTEKLIHNACVHINTYIFALS